MYVSHINLSGARPLLLDIFVEYETLGGNAAYQTPSISSDFGAVMWWILHKPASVTKTHQAPCSHSPALPQLFVRLQNKLHRGNPSVWRTTLLNTAVFQMIILHSHAAIQILLEAWERPIRSIGQISTQ